MTDFTHDGTDDGFHEIQLSGKQLVALSMIATTVFVFIFLCGVLVGRNLRDGGSTTAFAATSAATEAQSAQAQPADPPTPADTVDDLTYHRRLQGEATEPPPEPRPEPPVQAEPTPAAAAQPPPAASTPAAQPPPPVADDVAAEGRPGRFIVQVFASQNGQAAASVVRQLTAKGYPAYLVRPAASAKPPMFRVQVGRYDERKEAEAVSLRLQKEEQFKPWISSH